MQSPQSLRRPTNWQDFESLCKKLWGEVWNYPEAKKNGRSGQDQCGVDVYGMYAGSTDYIGIQCKGKDEYTNKQFTEKEILTEIEKVEKFKPALKKFYLATTAVKDTAIEEFVRIQNLAQLEKGLFEIHIFSWEDIVELIDENRQTHNWYVKNQNFVTRKNVDVVFQNGGHQITLKPKFKQHKIAYRKDSTKDLDLGITKIMNVLSSPMFDAVHRATFNARMTSPTINSSYAHFNIVIRNTGSESLEDYKLSFEIVGDIDDLNKSNVKDDFPAVINIAHYKPTTFIDFKTKSGDLIPNKSKLVGDDIFKSADIFIKTPPKSNQIFINWKLIANDFKTNGELIINIEPEIKSIFKEIIVDNVSDERIELGSFEDFIETRD